MTKGKEDLHIEINLSEMARSMGCSDVEQITNAVQERISKGRIFLEWGTPNLYGLSPAEAMDRVGKVNLNNVAAVATSTTLEKGLLKMSIAPYGPLADALRIPEVATSFSVAARGFVAADSAKVTTWDIVANKPDITPVPPVNKTIRELFDAWTAFYSVVHRSAIKPATKNQRLAARIKESHPDIDEVKLSSLVTMNSGDCGVAALAVGLVLEHAYGMDVTYWDNGGHCYISVRDVSGFHDAMGTFLTHADLLAAEPASAGYLEGPLTAAQMQQNRLPFDDLGMTYVRSFHTVVLLSKGLQPELLFPDFARNENILIGEDTVFASE